MTATEEISNPTSEEVVRNVRVEDKMRLRELELQTQYELKYLSNDLRDLRRCVESQSGTEAAKFESLNKRVAMLTYLALAQLAGIDAQSLVGLFKMLPM